VETGIKAEQKVTETKAQQLTSEKTYISQQDRQKWWSQAMAIGSSVAGTLQSHMVHCKTCCRYKHNCSFHAKTQFQLKIQTAQ